MSTKAEYRPMTLLESARALALSKCTLPPGSMTKRFARTLKEQAAWNGGVGDITEKQAAYLAVSAYRFRRQMPPSLVPETPPPGYETPKQARAKWELQQHMEKYKKTIQ